MRRCLFVSFVVGSCFGLVLSVLFAACKGEPKSPSKGTPSAHASQKDAASGTPEKGRVLSPLAGSWYEADPGRLAAEIDGYLKNVKGEPLSHVCALILPHAGLRWSGQTAAYGIKQLEGGKIRRVIILGPSHQVFFKNSASVPNATYYATPLGETPLDVDLIRELLKSTYFQVIPAANQGEHSVEVMLPVLQRAMGEFRFVPIVLGALDPASVHAIADELSRRVDASTLVVASSDFTHYGPNFRYTPFIEDVPENLKKLDMGAFRFIEEKDLQGFEAYVEKTEDTICGRAAIEVLLAMLSPDARVHLLHYETSGAMTGDFSNSVSYISAAVTGSWAGTARGEEGPTTARLSREDKRRLMALAKGTLKYYLEKGRVPTPEQLGIEITPGMGQVMGAFVTLKVHGMLRGCIGEIYPVRPVYQAVMAHAIDAAVNDQRFPPVREKELPELTFEISALGPPHPVSSYKDIILGRDGVVLRKNGHSAVFLPQVAPEQGWGLDETLSHLSRKAGLLPDAWKEGTSFTVFEAIVFGEGDV